MTCFQIVASFLSQNATFNELQKVTRSLWNNSSLNNNNNNNNNNANDFVFQYSDSEGDKITVSSTLEFQEALRVAQLLNISLKLTIIQTPSTKFSLPTDILLPFDMEDFTMSVNSSFTSIPNTPLSNSLLQSSSSETEKIFQDFLSILPSDAAAQLLSLSKVESSMTLSSTIDQNKENNTNNVFLGVLDPHEKVDVVDSNEHHDVEVQYLPQKPKIGDYAVTTMVDANSAYCSSSFGADYVLSTTDDHKTTVSLPQQNNKQVSEEPYAKQSSQLQEVSSKPVQYSTDSSFGQHPYCFAY